MNKLTKYALSELYEMSSGISTSKGQAGHGSPFVSFGTVFNNYFLPEVLPDLMDTSKKEQETYSIKKGDILITRTSETKDELAMSCVVLKDYPEATYSGFTKRLRPKINNIVYDKYMAFYLRSYLFRKSVTNNAFMTLRASFNEDIFSFLNVYLPEYEKQIRVGNFLYLLEQKKQLNNKVIFELESMAKTIYDYWFVQFDFPNNEGKPYRTSGGNMVYNEQLKREIPEGWKLGNLYSIADYINGVTCQKYKPNGNESTLPVIKIKEMHSGITNETEKVSFDVPDRYIINKGDILFSWSATLEVVYWSGCKACLNQHIFKVSPKQGYSNGYVYNQLLSYVNNFVRMAESRKTTMGHITTDHLKQSKITLPPNILLVNYENIVLPMYNQILHYKAENHELTKLQNWLLPMLMNGQATIE